MNSSSPSQCQLRFSRGWVDSAVMARVMRDAGKLHYEHVQAVHIILSCGCGIMVDAGTQLLSLVNQLAEGGRDVTLCFEDGYSGAMGYLHRIAFFDLLHSSVKTTPPRPKMSALAMAGSNPNVVEFKRICPLNRDRNTPSLLADALEGACQSRTDCKSLGHAAFTVFGELIDNIYEHSETEIDGYAALQVYKGGNGVLVSVSDSGRGLLETLRPSLPHNSPYAQTSDTALILQMLNAGLSRLEQDNPERGLGLCSCADHALKYSGQLTLRLSTSSLRVMPNRQTSQTYDGIAHCFDGLPFIQGTHFAFRFQLQTA